MKKLWVNGKPTAFSDIAKISKNIAWQIQNKILELDQISLNVGQYLVQPIVALLAPSGPELLAHMLGCWRLGMAIVPIAYVSIHCKIYELNQVKELIYLLVLYWI